MSDTTPTNPGDPTQRADAQPTAAQPTTTYPSSPAGWGAAPTPTSTATVDTPAPTHAPAGPYAQDPYAASWNAGAPNGSTPWYGNAATTPAGKRGGPKPPWFWPIVAVAVGLAALLVGGGIGFAIGHAIGGGTSQSTTQVPGNGTNGFPGGGTNGGTNQLPGSGTQGGTGSGTGTGTGTSGSSSNS
ncbi:hypothetical protein ACIPC2_10465 [Curtobacterium pusillum]|uniref:hypothetical protein n=1 Tax=Curtobacterium pusillum TaxID=69373 RepID=UPI0037FDAB80